MIEASGTKANSLSPLLLAMFLSQITLMLSIKGHDSFYLFWRLGEIGAIDRKGIWQEAHIRDMGASMNDVHRIWRLFAPSPLNRFYLLFLTPSSSDADIFYGSPYANHIIEV